MKIGSYIDGKELVGYGKTPMAAINEIMKQFKIEEMTTDWCHRNIYRLDGDMQMQNQFPVQLDLDRDVDSNIMVTTTYCDSTGEDLEFYDVEFVISKESSRYKAVATICQV